MTRCSGLKRAPLFTGCSSTDGSTQSASCTPTNASTHFRTISCMPMRDMGLRIDRLLLNPLMGRSFAPRASIVTFATVKGSSDHAPT